MAKELSGSCDCEAIQYELTAPAKLVVNCHCNGCRKRNGSSYSTYCVVSQSDLKVVRGQEFLTTYENSEGGKKLFCSKCGSPLYKINPRYPGMLMVLYGSLSDSTNLTPSVNVYSENKLPWVESISSIKSFDKAIVR